MKYKPLGDTGLKISTLSLGAAELGLDYGFKGAGNGKKPETHEAVRLIHRALDAGMNCIDTARAYGTSEEVIGQALSHVSSKPIIVSKVVIPENKDERHVRQEILSSIETTLRTLRIETLDVLLIHNTSLAVLQNNVAIDTLRAAQKQGKIRFPGASCYGDDVPFAVLSYPEFRVIQVPFNLFDQKMSKGFFQEAEMKGVGLFARSIYLRGFLTPLWEVAPDRLAPLKDRARKALAVARSEINSLSELALRFGLSMPKISSVLIGVRTIDELDENLREAEKGPLTERLVAQLEELSFGADAIVDTRTWRDIVI
jgi:aryl-alcohol dehydrogenase-like predicted oxidoreductase